MAEPITWVGLDTSKKKHVVAVLEPESEEVRELTIPNDVRAIRRFGRKLMREAPGEVRACYEAGPCGYALARELEGVGSRLRCEVVAPTLIPVRPGQRVKTDRRDALKLARLYRAGELTPVHAPTEAQEAVRDLLRCREDASEDLLRSRNRLSKLLLRRGRVYPGSAWTMRHDAWLSSQVWDQEADSQIIAEYRLAISQIADRVRDLDRRIDAIAQQEPYREVVGWLRCFRGIDTLIALTIVAEIQDFQRFRDARSFMGFLGLVPSEHSSGDRVRRGAITKTGNAHVRRVLVEAAWCNRCTPAVGQCLRKRRLGQPAWVIAHADRAMRRLYLRQARLRATGKPINKVITAAARELAGFIWGVMNEGQRRNPCPPTPTARASRSPSPPAVELNR